MRTLSGKTRPKRRGLSRSSTIIFVSGWKNAESLRDPGCWVAVADHAQNCLTRNRTLAERHLRRCVLGEVDVDPAPEADQPHPLPGGNNVARLCEFDDTARNQACNLRKAHFRPIKIGRAHV